jgi:hypothetical protein
MPPMPAMMVAGYMAKQLGAGRRRIGSRLDAKLNGDGNPLDDILRMAGKAMR